MKINKPQNMRFRDKNVLRVQELRKTPLYETNKTRACKQVCSQTFLYHNENL